MDKTRKRIILYVKARKCIILYVKARARNHTQKKMDRVKKHII
jgi:hypothetical protein